MGKCGKFLLGGVIGFAAGILLAPKSGVETRAFLKEKASAYMDNADVMTDNVRDRAVELYSTATDYAGDASSQLKEKIDVARTKIGDKAAAVKGGGQTTAVDAAVEAASEAVDAAGAAVDAAVEAEAAKA
ncbi:MAG: YtxH domain-containing protein [Coriobacteriia bacterium]|nr:YtxH domain-containing protein [Coriobacteriia bacterium]MCL2536704.1 YtxH domain-containing protein [Coriobacteriia bacterium]